MKGIGKSVRYFGLVNGKMIVTMLGMSLFFGVIFTFMDEGPYIENFISNFTNYLLIIVPLMILMQAVTGYTAYLSLTISMGSSRKNAILGMFIAYFIAVFLIVAGTFGLLAVLPSPIDYWELRYLILGLVFLIMVTANLLGAALLKLGPKAGFIVWMICYIVIICLVIVTISLTKGKGNVFTLMDMAKINTPWILLVGILLSVITLIAPYLAIRKYEVRV